LKLPLTILPRINVLRISLLSCSSYHAPPNLPESFSAALVPQPTNNDHAARIFVFLGGYKDASTGTLSMKRRKGPQRITESQYVEGCGRCGPRLSFVTAVLRLPTQNRSIERIPA